MMRNGFAAYSGRKRFTYHSCFSPSKYTAATGRSGSHFSKWTMRSSKCVLRSKPV